MCGFHCICKDLLSMCHLGQQCVGGVVILSWVISFLGHILTFAHYKHFFNHFDDHFQLGFHLKLSICLVINNWLLKNQIATVQASKSLKTVWYQAQESTNTNYQTHWFVTEFNKIQGGKGMIQHCCGFESVQRPRNANSDSFPCWDSVKMFSISKKQRK